MLCRAANLALTCVIEVAKSPTAISLPPLYVKEQFFSGVSTFRFTNKKDRYITFKKEKAPAL